MFPACILNQKIISQIFSLSISVNTIYCLFTSLLQEKIYQLNCLAFTTLNFLVFLELNESHHFEILFTKHEKEVVNFFSHGLKSCFAFEQKISRNFSFELTR